MNYFANDNCSFSLLQFFIEDLIIIDSITLFAIINLALAIQWYFIAILPNYLLKPIASLSLIFLCL